MDGAVVGKAVMSFVVKTCAVIGSTSLPGYSSEDICGFCLYYAGRTIILILSSAKDSMVCSLCISVLYVYGPV